ncbi:MAG: GNAT family N-acetyltransferase, partial [Gaiellaceae bacterium]
MTRVTVARSVEELEALREPWKQLQGRHFPTDPDAFLTILEHQPQAMRPHVLLLERDGEPRSLVLGRVEDLRLSAKLGYKEIFAPRMRSITVVNEGLLGDASEESAHILLAELRASLAAGEADVVRLRNLRLGSPLHRVARSAPPALCRQHVSSPAVHWELDLPGSPDEFLRSLSSSTREGVRRYGRKLEKEYGERLSLRIFREPAEIDELFEQVEVVSAKTYQGGLGVAFAGDALQRSLTALAMERGWFRAWVLSLDGEPVAFWHGEAYRGVFRIGVPGYDPAHARLRVGNYVLMRLVADLCAEEGVDRVDYGFGDAEYKRRFGTRSWQEEDVLVYAPTAKAIGINVLRTIILTLVGLAGRILRQSELFARIKRGWR